MSKFPEWTEIEWPHNSAIKLPCYVKSFGRHQVTLHQSFNCIDTEANDRNGEWVHGEGFDFVVKGCYSGRCPNTVTTLDEAKTHIEYLDRIGKIY